MSQDWAVQWRFTDPGDGSLSRGRVVAGYLLATVGGVLLTLAPAPAAAQQRSVVRGDALPGPGRRHRAGGRPGPAPSPHPWSGCCSSTSSSPLPLHSLTIASGWNVLTLAVYVLTSVAVSAVVDSAARRRHQAAVAGQEATTLAGLNRSVLGGEYGVDALLRLVAETFGATRAELVPRESLEDPRPDATVVPAGRGHVLVVEGGEPGGRGSAHRARVRLPPRRAPRAGGGGAAGRRCPRARGRPTGPAPRCWPPSRTTCGRRWPASGRPPTR